MFFWSVKGSQSVRYHLNYLERLSRNSQNELTENSLIFLVPLYFSEFFQKSISVLKSFDYSKPRQLLTTSVNTEKIYYDSLSNSWMKFNFLFDRAVTMFTL